MSEFGHPKILILASRGGKLCSEMNWESCIQKLKENEAEKREENPNEKWLGDTNIFGSFLTAETFHIYSSGALMYLQPVFRAFVPVKERSGRGGIFWEQFQAEFVAELMHRWRRGGF